MNSIFAGQHVADTALDVHRRALRMAVEERFTFLSKWLLPGVEHDGLRMQVGFSPTNPAPPVDFDMADAHTAATTNRRRTGGELVSPVFDLVDAAQELGRLNELRDRVSAWNAGEQRDAQLAQSAMLTLIDLANDDLESASLNFEQLLHVTAFGAANGSDPSPAELLVFPHGLEFSKTREAVAERLFRYHNWMTADFYRSIPRRHVSAMLGRMRAFQLQSLEEEDAAAVGEPMQQWFPVSRTTASTRGRGSPPARWYSRPGYVENTASHDEDYLYFALPLRGNYEVECDVSGFEWRDSHLLVAGTWVAPIYTHAGYDIGSFRGHRPRVEFTPPLTKIRDWLHYRTVVRDGTATTYFNGRKVHEEPLSENHDPWLAIRSSPRHDGAVRNLRITGEPVVPETLHLSIERGLHPWLSYFEGPRGGGSDTPWYYFAGDEGGEIAGARSSAIDAAAAGSIESHAPAYREALLRYHRPMLEDGTIEYDFYYVPGEFHTHPALDRLAFLLEPDGVRLHWITDGKHDRTDLSPSNVFDEPDNRRGPGQLPLKTKDWNRLRLQLSGDTVTLALNGQEVYERRLELTNQRTFGLFYYFDRTQTRVRKVVWKGAWPRKLPPLAEQELFVEEAEFLDRDRDRLAAVFEHDFAKGGLPFEQFSIVRGDPTVHLMETSEGLLAERSGTGGYRNATIAPRLKVEGDFDIVATYDKFASNPSKDGSGSLYLMAITENATSDECYVARRHIHRSTGSREQYGHCVTVKRLQEGDRREFFDAIPMEESSGTLRLARRGDRVYFMTAEGDSPHFRLRGQRRFSQVHLQPDGIRLIAQIHQLGGATSVVWKDVVVRAERLTGPAVEDFDAILAKLNAERDRLPSRFAHDFAKQAPTEDLFYRWADRRAWNKDDGGLTIVSPGTDNWTSAGASVQRQVSGDFDIVARFDVLKFDKPKSGARCAVYLQLEVPDKDQTQVSLIFCNDQTGRTEVIAQKREPRGNGESEYRHVGGAAFESVQALRIARRGGELTFLVSAKNEKRERVVGTLDFSELPIPSSNLRFMVHTGGAGLESRVLWKAIDIRAEKIEPAAAPPAKEPKPKGVFDSIFHLLR